MSDLVSFLRNPQDNSKSIHLSEVMNVDMNASAIPDIIAE